MANPLIVDGRNLLDPDETRRGGLRLRGHRPAGRRATCCRPRPSARQLGGEALVEAIILAGGKAERLGDAAGRPPEGARRVAGKPLAAYQVGRLALAGVTA